MGPGVSAAAISAFSVPITDGSSMKIAHGFEAALGGGDPDRAVALDSGAEVLEGVEVRIEAPAADEIAARRRHLRLAEARQQWPASRNEARILAESSSSGAVL